MKQEPHKGGVPDLGQFEFPHIDAKGVYSIFIGAIDAAKERTKKECVREFIALLEELKGRDGCVAVEVVKRVLTEGK